MSNMVLALDSLGHEKYVIARLNKRPEDPNTHDHFPKEFKLEPSTVSNQFPSLFKRH